jgi:hypothetical protein
MLQNTTHVRKQLRRHPARAAHTSTLCPEPGSAICMTATPAVTQCCKGGPSESVSGGPLGRSKSCSDGVQKPLHGVTHSELGQLLRTTMLPHGQAVVSLLLPFKFTITATVIGNIT